MRWIRSYIRGLARLALFALVVQIVLTFDHVHIDSLTLTSAEAVQSTAVDQAALATADGKNQKSHGTADTDCPICALIQLASTSTPSVALPLPVPTPLGETILEVPEATRFAATRAFAFQARGPPII